MKDKSSSVCFDLVLEYFDSLIKTVNIHKDIVRAAMENKGTLLEPNERNFLVLIKGEDYSALTGTLMAQVAQSLIRNPKVEA